MNKVKILFFATFRDRAGTKSAEIEVPDGITVREFKEKITQLYPGLNQSIKTALVSINREYAFDDSVLPPSAEVGIFPAVSGG